VVHTLHNQTSFVSIIWGLKKLVYQERGTESVCQIFFPPCVSLSFLKTYKQRFLNCLFIFLFKLSSILILTLHG